MSTQTETPDGAAILKEMVRQAEHILQSDWPAGVDLSKIRRACSPSNIRAIAAHVKALEAENAELRNWLQELVDESGGLTDGTGSAFSKSFEELRNNCRAALNTEGE